jgi:hypothetical protein
VCSQLQQHVDAGCLTAAEEHRGNRSRADVRMSPAPSTPLTLTDRRPGATSDAFDVGSTDPDHTIGRKLVDTVHHAVALLCVVGSSACETAITSLHI